MAFAWLKVKPCSREHAACMHALQVVTVEAVYSGTSWGEGDPKEDDAISAKLRQ